MYDHKAFIMSRIFKTEEQIVKKKKISKKTSGAMKPQITENDFNRHWAWWRLHEQIVNWMFFSTVTSVTTAPPPSPHPHPYLYSHLHSRDQVRTSHWNPTHATTPTKCFTTFDAHVGRSDVCRLVTCKEHIRWVMLDFYWLFFLFIYF